MKKSYLIIIVALILLFVAYIIRHTPATDIGDVPVRYVPPQGQIIDTCDAACHRKEKAA